MTNTDLPKPAKPTLTETGAFSSQSSLAQGVTGRNYAEKAEAFMRLNKRADGKVGFMISTEDRVLQHGDRLVETLHEWGAWRGFFKRLGLRLQVAGMDRLGFYMVPAQWPHLFSADETSGIDYAAGNSFAQEWQDRKARERDYGSAAVRQLQIAAAKKRFPWDRRPLTPEEHLGAKEPPPQSSEELRTKSAPASSELKEMLGVQNAPYTDELS